MVSTTVARLLKQQTAHSHAAVEEHLGLLDPGLTLDDLSRVLQRFHGFWRGTEPQIDAWAVERPALARTLRWRRRRRTELFAGDLETLGLDRAAVRAQPIAPAVWLRPNDADVFGWLYVAEGSTLGGAIIDRRLRDLTAGLSLRSFTPYAEGPGPMWHAYGAALAVWVGDDPDRTAVVVGAAVRAFAELESWLASASAGSAV